MGDGQAIPEKLGIEEGMTVVVLQEPNWFTYDLGDLPEGVTVHRDSFEQPADVFLIFSASPNEAERGLQRVLTVLPAHGVVWMMWERDAPETLHDQVDEETLRELFADTDLVPDDSSVINETWQGLRFMVAEEKRDDWEEIRLENPFRE